MSNMAVEVLVLHEYYHQVVCEDGENVTGLCILCQSYLSSLSSKASEGLGAVLSEILFHRLASGPVDAYAARSNASYISPSSSSVALIPLLRKASFSGCMAADSWLCLKPIISVSGDERAVEASLL